MVGRLSELKPQAEDGLLVKIGGGGDQLLNLLHGEDFPLGARDFRHRHRRHRVAIEEAKFLGQVEGDAEGFNLNDRVLWGANRINE